MRRISLFLVFFFFDGFWNAAIDLQEIIVEICLLYNKPMLNRLDSEESLNTLLVNC